MITLHSGGMPFIDDMPAPNAQVDTASARKGTIAHGILSAHNHTEKAGQLKMRFDALASHDITYVGIIQTARASGLKCFPVPYALTNCHNSLCAVGGTINEDDHAFGLSAARKYGGIYVPAHLAVIHQYAREALAACGSMILGSDSHTRYGALGTMGIGEGGPELVKQLLGHTYDVETPEVVGVYLTGRLHSGVGPQDVALALVKAVFANGFAKNRVLEFIGPGVGTLTVDERNGIDVMTTETACLSSIWRTDDVIRAYYQAHGRPDAYKALAPAHTAYYDAFITIELDKVKPMIALPFHPSNAYTIEEFLSNAEDILAGVELEAAGMVNTPPSLRKKYREGALFAEQGVIGGCSGGTYENIMWAANALKGRSTGAGAFALSVYPASQPVYMALIRAGAAESLMASGAVLRTAFCGPCFGAGDTPANEGLSLRHTTRNFPSREGSKPQSGQLAYVALMDARSIAATALSGGRLTAADTLDIPPYTPPEYTYDDAAYGSRVYNGCGQPMPDEALILGPGIADWPKMDALRDTLVMRVCAAIYDAVTTTDELIPSGETSSYRSNPHKLAEFTLSRKDPKYVERAKGLEREALLKAAGCEGQGQNVTTGSCVFALKPGDGSAREQAASCQRVLGGVANIAGEYATKRYRSNVINWGMLPFTMDSAAQSGIAVDDIVRVDGVRGALTRGDATLPATLIKPGGTCLSIALSLPQLTDEERDIILDGCLINYYRR